MKGGKDTTEVMKSVKERRRFGGGGISSCIETQGLESNTEFV